MASRHRDRRVRSVLSVAVRGAETAVSGVAEVTVVTTAAVSDAVHAAIKGGGEVSGDMSTVARRAAGGVALVARNAGMKLERAAFEIARAAIYSTEETGGDLASVVKSTVEGTIDGTRDVGGDVMSGIRSSTRGLIMGTAEVGGDVAAVARNAVEAAIEGARKIGLRAEEAAAAAAAGATEAAGEISESTAAAVTRAVSETILGVKAVIEAPFRRPVILLVDSNRGNVELLRRYLRRGGYETRSAASLEALDQVVQRGDRVSLAVIDLSDFDRSIWEHCDGLRKARIPFLVISPRRSATVQRYSLQYGARGVLVKPVEAKDLVGHIRSLLGH